MHIVIGVSITTSQDFFTGTARYIGNAIPPLNDFNCRFILAVHHHNVLVFAGTLHNMHTTPKVSSVVEFQASPDDDDGVICK